MSAGLASSKFDFTFVTFYDVETRNTRLCFTAHQAEYRDVFEKCIEELPASPAQLLLSLCRICKYNDLDEESKEIRTEVNKIRTSVGVNPYLLTSPEQQIDVDEHMRGLTILAQRCAEQLSRVAYCHRFLDNVARFSGHCGQEQANDFETSVNSLRSELQALERIEEVHQHEVQALFNMVSVALPKFGAYSLGK